MAALKINRGINAHDRAETIPPEQWPELLTARRGFCKRSLASDCRLILLFVEDAEGVNWFGFESRERYLSEGLGLDPQVVEWALAGLHVVGVEAPRKLSATVEVGKLGKHGANQHTREDSGRDNVTSSDIPRGNGAAYTLARLERDAPELAAKVRTGELSANAAAIEAGFRKLATALDRLRAAWRKASSDERAAFLKEVSQQR